MAKPLKIEQHNLQQIVADGVASGLNPQQIADICSEAARESISNMAVIRYLRAVEEGKASTTPRDAPAAVATADESIRRPKLRPKLKRIAPQVDKELDVIGIQHQITHALLDRFNYVVALPDYIEDRLQQLTGDMQASGADAEYLASWSIGLVDDIRRNVTALSQLSRELRETSKFVISLREKAFEFSLIQEYLMLFMEVFREASPEAYEVAEQRIASNPRMQRIVEQQKELRGYEE